MQQGSAAAAVASPVAPRTPVASAMAQEPSSRPSTPTMGMAPVNPAVPVIPKTGMTVQELKQLTTLRLASQSVSMHQHQQQPPDVTGLVGKAMLTNVAKSHYRDSLRSSLTPTSTPKRGPVAARGAPSAMSLAPEVRGNRSRSRSSQLAKTVEAPSEATQLRYSYSGGQTIDDYLSFDNNSTSSQVRTDLREGRARVTVLTILCVSVFVWSRRRTRTRDRRSTWTTARVDTLTTKYVIITRRLFCAANVSRLTLLLALALVLQQPTHQSLQFPDDSFPPPPPMDENGGFVGNSLPSWSPPPSKAKKYESGGSVRLMRLLLYLCEPPR